MSNDESNQTAFNSLFKLMKGKTYGKSKTMIDSMAHKAEELSKADTAKSVKDYKGREIRADRILVISATNLVLGKVEDSDYCNISFIKDENKHSFTIVSEEKLSDVKRDHGNYYMAIAGSHFVLVKESRSIDITKHYVINYNKKATISDASKKLITEKFEKGVVTRLSSPSGTIALKALALSKVMSEKFKNMVSILIETFKGGNASNKRKQLIAQGVELKDANLMSGMYGYLANAFSSVFAMSGSVGKAVIMPFIYCAIKNDWSLLRKFSIMTKLCDPHWDMLKFDVPETYLRKSEAYIELKVAVNQKGIWSIASPEFNYDALMDFLTGNDNEDMVWYQCQEVYNHWKARFDKTAFNLVGPGKGAYCVIEGGYSFSVPDDKKSDKSVYHIGTVGIEFLGIIVGKVDKTSATQYLNADLLKDFDKTPKNELRSLYLKNSSTTYPFLNALYSSAKDDDYFKVLAQEDADENYTKVIKNLIVNEAKGLLKSDIFDYFDDDWDEIFTEAFKQLKSPLCGIMAEVILFQTVQDHEKMEDEENTTAKDKLYNELCTKYDSIKFDKSSLLPHLKTLIGNYKNGDVGKHSLLMCNDFKP